MNRLSFVRSVWDDMLVRGGIEKVLIPNLQIVGARKNFVRAQLQIEPQHTNRLGIVHGGLISTLVDVGGSLALSSQGMFMTGVTIDMATTFLRAGGKPQDTLTIDCHLQRMGRTMAFTFIELGTLYDEKLSLVARGNHTKYVAAAMKSERNVEPNWDD